MTPENAPTRAARLLGRLRFCTVTFSATLTTKSVLPLSRRSSPTGLRGPGSRANAS